MLDYSHKVAFLFLLYDGLSQPGLWEAFFKNADSGLHTVHIHWKTLKPLGYFEKYRLHNCVPTEYAQKSLVKAQNLLIRSALKDPLTQRFVLVSDSCIPLKRFEQVYEAVFDVEKCRFNCARKDHIFEHYELGRNVRLAETFGKQNVRKASQWSILTRPVAELLAQTDELLDKIYEEGTMEIPDEYFYISYLHYLGKSNELQTTCYAAEKATTFEFWDDKDYPFRENFTTTHTFKRRKLKTYCDISSTELDFLLNAPCFFGRKFAPGCTVDGKKDLEDVLIHKLQLKAS